MSNKPYRRSPRPAGVYFPDQAWKNSPPYMFWSRLKLRRYCGPENTPPQKILTPLCAKHRIDQTDLSHANLESTKKRLDCIAYEFWSVFTADFPEDDRPSQQLLSRVAWDWGVDQEDISPQNIERMHDALYASIKQGRI